ncbi:hypothetical protein PPL_08702 [Heterostelium album PN500]|uniref:SD-repeat containing protein B domain-containing protein n=1 Tax=Heterostelium pallidum (strain ATCC 26659 / Pp 5 / PN500) TaxID=670386 RepID=D3BJH6_HETP5|nr:hypothetical protein PPL_08702 [Heterostelium album PN500]EFA78056.1 hypothetical protein PPL_08702 [Heterostelium album PN500]|eukprot:XP_020430183.1 hypothetical protein PPL_08702 [Heterostelium album PN500]
MKSILIGLFLLVSLLTISSVNGLNMRSLQFLKSPDLSCIINPYSGSANQEFRITDGSLGSFSISKPSSQTKATSIISGNYKMPSPCINNTQLAQFFGLSSGNQGFASMVQHFNCRGEGPTCETFKLDRPTAGVCILVANVDADDKLIVQSSSMGVAIPQTKWNFVSQGIFDPSGPNCAPIDSKATTSNLILGCYSKDCANPNYSIYRMNDTVDNITFCYESHSENGMVSYAVTACPVSQRPTPVVGVKYAVSGIAFRDLNKNGIYDIGVDMPLPNIRVNIINENTGQVPFDAFNDRVAPAITNSYGYYIFQALLGGWYTVNFEFKGGSVVTQMPSTIQTMPKTSKIYDNFKTFKFILNSDQTVPVSSGEIDPITDTSRILRDMNGGII